MEFLISTEWDGAVLDHDPATITLTSHPEGVKMLVEAVFFDDPSNPGGTPGEPFPGLWDYEGLYSHVQLAIFSKTSDVPCN